MADFDDYEDEVETPQPLDPNIRKQLREAEKIRKEAETLRSELNAQKRELEFTKAGIPDSPLGALFRKGYDGEASAEAIRKAAEEYGVLQATRAQEPSNDSELEALRRAQGVTASTSGAMPDQEQEYLTALASASTPEEVMKVVQGDLGKKLNLSTSLNNY